MARAHCEALKQREWSTERRNATTCMIFHVGLNWGLECQSPRSESTKHQRIF